MFFIICYRGKGMSEEKFYIEQKNFKNKFGFENDYRATVGG